MYRFLATCLVQIAILQVCGGEFVSDVNIVSFSLSGLAYDGNEPTLYQCCDDNAADNCTDPCDPYFTICLGRWNEGLPQPCQGASYTTSRFRNTNSLTRLVRTRATSASALLPVELHMRIFDRDDDFRDIDDVIATFHTAFLREFAENEGAAEWIDVNFNSGGNSVSLRVRYYNSSMLSESEVPLCEVSAYAMDRMQCVGGSDGFPDCADGWTGERCDEDINECLVTAQCKNGGICYNEKPGYRCDCQSGWTGPDCAENIDECIPVNPCQNGGICYNEMPGYRCHCANGWSGDRCTQQKTTTNMAAVTTKTTTHITPTTRKISPFIGMRPDATTGPFRSTLPLTSTRSTTITNPSRAIKPITTTKSIRTPTRPSPSTQQSTIAEQSTIADAETPITTLPFSPTPSSSKSSLKTNTKYQTTTNNPSSTQVTKSQEFGSPSHSTKKSTLSSLIVHKTSQYYDNTTTPKSNDHVSQPSVTMPQMTDKTTQSPIITSKSIGQTAQPSSSKMTQSTTTKSGKETAQSREMTTPTSDDSSSEESNESSDSDEDNDDQP